MPFDLKYGHVHVDGDTGPIGEAAEKGIAEKFESKKVPCFILLATDSLALDAIMYYQSKALTYVVNKEFHEGIEDVVEVFEEFKSLNPDEVRLPD